jgi:hypothetical protein
MKAPAESRSGPPSQETTPMTALALILPALVLGPFPVPAEHAKITLDLIAGGEQATSYVDQTPPDSGKNPRPVLKAKAGEPIQVKYMLTNVYPHKTLEDVVVHFYVARIDAVGQKTLPALEEGEDLVLETAFDMDFRPGGHAGGRSRFRVAKPGVYLVRVETRQTQSDHEHFAAIDLVVEGE